MPLEEVEELKTSKGASRIYIVMKKMATANEEYHLELKNARGFRIQCRDGTAFRFAFEKDKVGTAAPSEPYYTVLANSHVTVRNIEVEDLHVYMACGGTGKVAELIVQGD